MDTILHRTCTDGAKWKLCYCGNHGCMETLCSLDALLNDNESLDSFFEKVRNNEINETKRWQQYLSHLSRSINLLHLIYDQDLSLAGILLLIFRKKISPIFMKKSAK